MPNLPCKVSTTRGLRGVVPEFTPVNAISMTLRMPPSEASQLEAASESETGDADNPLVVARGVELKGQWGHVFGPLNFTLDSGGVTIISAPNGAARTALLMALAGRMKISAGDLKVLGYLNDQPKVFDHSSICCFDELDGFQPSVTVRDLITEQMRWEAHWWEWVPQATTKDMEKMCGYLFDGLPLPPIDAFLADIPEVEQMLLRIGVANTKRPPLLVVGRLDHITDNEQREQVLAVLKRLGEEQSIITTDVNATEDNRPECQVLHIEGLLEFQQRATAAEEIEEEMEREFRRGGDKADDGADADEDGDDAGDTAELDDRKRDGK